MLTARTSLWIGVTVSAVIALLAFATLVVALAASTGCASHGGSLQDVGAYLAPSSASFERELPPFTPANPTPVTVTVVVQGGGGGEAIGSAANAVLPGAGWLVGGALSLVGLAVGGKKVAPYVQAVPVLMQSLELAPPEVRTWVRDRARAVGLSSFLEKLIADGKVPAAPKHEEPKT